MSNRHVIAESRDGQFRAVTREWDHNGSASVTVLNMRPGDIRSALLAPSPETIRAARDVARRTDPMDETRWTRLDKIEHGPGGTVAHRFTVSRLDPTYR